MLRAAVLALLSLGLVRPTAAETSGGVTVFAAASLTSVVTEIAAEFTAQGLGDAQAVFGSSGTLARQIEYGAPADVYLSANSDWVTYLGARQLIIAGTRRTLAGNQLVVVVPDDSGIKPDASNPLADLLTKILARGPLAIADPNFVPAGRYAKQSLIRTGHWAAVANHAVLASDVRAALKWIARGDVAGGIVYGTDAAIEPSVRVVYRFPPKSHSPIRYEAAAVSGARNPDAAGRFLEFLQGPAARALFRRFGFQPPPNSGGGDGGGDGGGSGERERRS